MKKRRGSTLIELVMTVFLIGIICLMTAGNFSTENAKYDKEVYRIKSELRNMSMKSVYSGKVYSMVINRDGYEIRGDDNVESREVMPENIHILSPKRKITYNIMSRTGAPVLGGTVYVYDEKIKRLTKITIMLGSGRVKSYKADINKQNSYIDNMMELKERWDD